MEKSIRILVVEDYEPARRFICSALPKQPKLLVVAEASDGFLALQKTEELKPDMILLDVGLPKMNGIEAAKQIRSLSPTSKILFVSQESSSDVVEAALATGASGYVFKGDIASELLIAVNAVLRGETFVSKAVGGRGAAASSF